MNPIHVTSEIGQLKKVLLHRPDDELLNLTPDTLEELLFDDIPFLKNAQKEHDEFATKLRENGVEVIYLEDLAKDVLAQSSEIREKFLLQYIDEAGVTSEFYKKALFDFLNGIKDSKALILKTMAGIKVRELGVTNPNSLTSRVLDKDSLLVDPMPNLYFTRDPFACIGNGVSLHKMFSLTRCRETIYGEYIFNYHKDYAGKVEKFYDRYTADNIEGGDILNISKKVLAIGISQRTTASAIEVLAHNVFFKRKSSIETVLAFKIPAKRAFMHLDTVFTQIDYDKFTIHPGILGPLEVFEITRGAKDGELHVEFIQDELKNILAKHTGTKAVDLIQCAGGDKIAAEREQWNDGSNTLCIKPGTVIVYDRNDITNELLLKKGIKVVEIPSAEISRGRGGPRCMSMPLFREDL
ncbi:arginine deiminase [Treponema pedis]|uniref:arginine deiminase n=1 Tax=Treponema pedis TaxID=409322 RepID=UPI00040BD2A0|nr:arginine deiminase [Treponema pedis]